MRFLGLLLLLLSFSAAAKTSEDWAVEGSKNFHGVLLECPDRIWPGMDWSKTQFIFASAKENKAWLLSPASPLPEAVADLPPVAFQAAFSFLEYRGLTTVTVATDLPWFGQNMSPFDLAVHEMFHHNGQVGWARGEGQRGTLVPLDWKPRYTRAEMINFLRSQLVSGVGLEKAANAYAEWANIYPHEVMSSTDGYEGTARYVEYLGRIFSKRGCGMTRMELFNEYRKLAGQFQGLPGLELDSEGYAAGSIAGFLLDIQGTEWKSRMASGDTPTKILLEGNQIGVNAPDDALAKQFKIAFAEQNAEIDSWRVPFEEQLSSSDYVRVSVPGPWLKGSYSPKGFYIPSTDPAAVYTPFAGEHRFTGEGQKFIMLADGKVGYSREALKECGDALWYALVNRRDLQTSAEGYSAQTEDLQMNVGGTIQTGADGFEYLCTN